MREYLKKWKEETTVSENKVVNEQSAGIKRLYAANCKFGMKNGFLCLELSDGQDVRSYERVFLHRAFPYELPDKYISVQEEENREVGIIYDISQFEESTEALLRRELERKYYSPNIKEIKSVKERYGFSYWKIIDESGKEMTFTVKDTFKSIKHTGDDSITVIDVDGNRFTVKSIRALSSKSYRKIELYL